MAQTVADSCIVCVFATRSLDRNGVHPAVHDERVHSVLKNFFQDFRPRTTNRIPPYAIEVECDSLINQSRVTLLNQSLQHQASKYTEFQIFEGCRLLLRTIFEFSRVVESLEFAVNQLSDGEIERVDLRSYALDLVNSITHAFGSSIHRDLGLVDKRKIPVRRVNGGDDRFANFTPRRNLDYTPKFGASAFPFTQIPEDQPYQVPNQQLGVRRPAAYANGAMNGFGNGMNGVGMANGGGFGVTANAYGNPRMLGTPGPPQGVGKLPPTGNNLLPPQNPNLAVMRSQHYWDPHIGAEPVRVKKTSQQSKSRHGKKKKKKDKKSKKSKKGKKGKKSHKRKRTYTTASTKTSELSDITEDSDTSSVTDDEFQNPNAFRAQMMQTPEYRHQQALIDSRLQADANGNSYLPLSAVPPDALPGFRNANMNAPINPLQAMNMGTTPGGFRGFMTPGFPRGASPPPIQSGLLTGYSGMGGMNGAGVAPSAAYDEMMDQYGVPQRAHELLHEALPPIPGIQGRNPFPPLHQVAEEKAEYDEKEASESSDSDSDDDDDDDDDDEADSGSSDSDASDSSSGSSDSDSSEDEIMKEHKSKTSGLRKDLEMILSGDIDKYVRMNWQKNGTTQPRKMSPPVNSTRKRRATVEDELYNPPAHPRQGSRLLEASPDVDPDDDEEMKKLEEDPNARASRRAKALRSSQTHLEKAARLRQQMDSDNRDAMKSYETIQDETRREKQKLRDREKRRAELRKGMYSLDGVDNDPSIRPGRRNDEPRSTGGFPDLPPEPRSSHLSAPPGDDDDNSSELLYEQEDNTRETRGSEPRPSIGPEKYPTEQQPWKSPRKVKRVNRNAFDDDDPDMRESNRRRDSFEAGGDDKDIDEPVRPPKGHHKRTSTRIIMDQYKPTTIDGPAGPSELITWGMILIELENFNDLINPTTKISAKDLVDTVTKLIYETFRDDSQSVSYMRDGQFLVFTPVRVHEASDDLLGDMEPSQKSELLTETKLKQLNLTAQSILDRLTQREEILQFCMGVALRDHVESDQEWFHSAELSLNETKQTRDEWRKQNFGVAIADATHVDREVEERIKQHRVSLPSPPRSSLMHLFNFMNDGELNYQDGNGDTALMVACGITRVDGEVHPTRAPVFFDVVQGLITAKCDVNMRTKEGLDALMVASMNAGKDTVRLLLQNGANKESRGKGRWNKTPLLIACRYNRKPVVEVLLQHQVKTDEVSSDGTTALMFAAMQPGNIETLELLLSQYGFSSEVNQANIDGYTALHFAAVTRDYQSIQILLNYGASKRTRANNGNLPKDMLGANANPDLVEMLEP